MNCKDCKDTYCGGQGADYENPNCSGYGGFINIKKPIIVKVRKILKSK
jgi:hypothetical protein